MTTLASAAGARAKELMSVGAPTATPKGVPAGWRLWGATWKTEDQGGTTLETLAEVYLTSTGDIVSVDRELLIQPGHSAMVLDPLGVVSLLKPSSSSWWVWACSKPQLGLNDAESLDAFLKRRIESLSVGPARVPLEFALPLPLVQKDGRYWLATLRSLAVRAVVGVAMFAAVLWWHPLGESWFAVIVALLAAAAASSAIGFGGGVLALIAAIYVDPLPMLDGLRFLAYPAVAFAAALSLVWLEEQAVGTVRGS